MRERHPLPRKYVADRGHDGERVAVDTRAGVKTSSSSGTPRSRGARSRRHGRADPRSGPTSRWPAGDPLHEQCRCDGVAFEAACVSMGNPHCVVFLDRARGSPWNARPGDRDPRDLPREDQRGVQRGRERRTRCACASGSAASARPWHAGPARAPWPSPAVCAG